MENWIEQRSVCVCVSVYKMKERRSRKIESIHKAVIIVMNQGV